MSQALASYGAVSKSNTIVIFIISCVKSRRMFGTRDHTRRKR
jgi:hypothetical protein